MNEYFSHFVFVWPAVMSYFDFVVVVFISTVYADCIRRGDGQRDFRLHLHRPRRYFRPPAMEDKELVVHRPVPDATGEVKAGRVSRRQQEQSSAKYKVTRENQPRRELS